MWEKARCSNELSTAIPRLDASCFKPLVWFRLLPGLDLVLVLCLLQKLCPGSLEELPWCSAALSHGVFSQELACAAAQEILVAPLLQSLLFGARAGFGLAHILQCLTALKGCCRLSRAAEGVAELGAAFVPSSRLAQIPVFVLTLLGVLWESAGLRKSWNETGVRARSLITVGSFLLVGSLMLVGDA